MNFNRLAPVYQAMETITAGGKLQRCRLEFLGHLSVPRQILLAGEGNGRFLEECVRRFPDAKIVVVDASAGMLKIAAEKTRSKHVEFVVADLLHWNPPPGAFDLIVTNFFLDCLSGVELPVVIAALGKAATHDAVWLQADFQVASGKLAGWRCRGILALLYVFFRLVCGIKARALVPPDPELRHAGFVLCRRVTSDWGLLKSEWWQRG